MSARNDGGPAFPYGNPTHGGEEGMSLRDWFAGMAMQSLIREGEGYNAEVRQILPMVATAYEWADAMIAERAK